MDDLLDPYTVKACAKAVWKTRPPKDIEPENIRVIISNENVLTFHRLMVMIEPDRGLEQSIREYKNLENENTEPRS